MRSGRSGQCKRLPLKLGSGKSQVEISLDFYYKHVQLAEISHSAFCLARSSICATAPSPNAAL
jgi:hypothetical protein